MVGVPFLGERGLRGAVLTSKRLERHTTGASLVGRQASVREGVSSNPVRVNSFSVDVSSVR